MCIRDSDRGDARSEEFRGLLGIGSEVEVGVEDLAFVQLRTFFSLRLLDLYDKFAACEDV